MKQLDPSTGPIARDQFADLVNAPFGEAAKVIRRYDPQWGRAEGEKFDWVVTVEATGSTGKAYIKAASQEEADKLADKITESEIDWDCNGDFTILSVEPHKQK